MIGVVSLPRLPFVFGLALLIAFILPTTGHGDLFINTYNSTFILTDHPNFYHALADEPTAVFPAGLSGGPYGPLYYYPTAAWLLLLDTVHLTDIDAWTSPGDETLRSLTNILLIKLPNLAIYLLVALVLLKTFRREGGEIASGLWLANPAVILFFLMMGQNDGWTVLASVAALFFGMRALHDQPLSFGRHRLPLRLLAMLALAIGAAIKLSPILMVLPFAWILGRNYREKALLAATGIGGFLVLVAPFLGTEYFWDHGLFGRESGQVPDLPLAGVAVLYLSYLALVVFAAERDPRRVRVLLLSFLALHALLYLLPGWKPQRAILFIGALSLAVPVRRMFLLPYLSVTAFALLLALENGNEIASDLFAPLTRRALLIPPMFDSRIEPLHFVLYALGAVTWIAALASLWRRGPVLLSALRWSPRIPILLAAVLVVYLAVSFSRLPNGVQATPFTTGATPQEVAAGETFSFFFFSGQDDLRAVTFWLDAGEASSAVRLTDGEGRVLYSQAAQQLTQGPNRVELGHIEKARRMGYEITVTPSQPIRVRMVEVPQDFAVASAELDGSPLPGSAAYTLDHETTWGGLVKDGLSQLWRDWQTLAASVVICGAGFAVIWRRQASSRREAES